MDNEYNYYDTEQGGDPKPQEQQTEHHVEQQAEQQAEQPQENHQETYQETYPETEKAPEEGVEKEAEKRAEQENRTQGQIPPLYESVQPPKRKKKKEKKQIHIGVKWVSCIAMAIVFGIVACATFQAGNIVLNKFTGNSTTSSSTKGKAVSSTQVSTNTNSTVNSDIADVVENVMPSVVSITNLSVQQVQDFFGGVRQQESQSSGSGIIIGKNDSELLIVTNNHVVEGSSTLTVSFVDDESVEAQIKGTDADKDLAVVAVQLSQIKDSTAEAIKTATLGDSNALRVGEPAIAIGNALGYGQSVTNGIISATGRTIEGFDTELIQTNAAINPGNSGGALLNANGEVIGINTVKVNADAVEGMGYAIPISDVTDILNDLMNRQTRTKVSEDERGAIGISGLDVASEASQAYNMPEGVYVKEVTKGSGAEEAGLVRGNIITAIDGTQVDGMDALKEQLEYYKAGETVELTIQTPEKNGEYKESTVQVTLGKAS